MVSLRDYFYKEHLRCRRRLIFMGRSGAKINYVQETLEDIVKRTPHDKPQIMIIHIGSNNMGVDSAFRIESQMKTLVKYIKKEFPHTCLIWSQILVRRFWTAADDQQAMELVRHRLNKKFRHLFHFAGDRVVRSLLRRRYVYVWRRVASSSFHNAVCARSQELLSFGDLSTWRPPVVASEAWRPREP